MRKFEAMLNWARHKIRTKTSSKLDAKLEFKCIMERLARDLKLYRISPQELIKVHGENREQWKRGLIWDRNKSLLFRLQGEILSLMAFQNAKFSFVVIL